MEVFYTIISIIYCYYIFFVFTPKRMQNGERILIHCVLVSLVIWIFIIILYVYVNNFIDITSEQDLRLVKLLLDIFNDDVILNVSICLIGTVVTILESIFLPIIEDKETKKLEDHLIEK